MLQGREIDMNTNQNTENPLAIPGNPAETLSATAIARRHALLKGVGKGSAVLAATVPLQTLAGQSLLTFDGKHQCSVSGQHSGVHSATPKGTLRCGGYSPGWWGQWDKDGNPKNWPAGINSGADVTSILSKSTLKNNDGVTTPTLFQIMDPKDKSGKFSNTDEFHWVCAWLNAMSGSFNFPYTGPEVIAFYDAGVGTPKYEDALTFFKEYMETHLPP